MTEEDDLKMGNFTLKNDWSVLSFHEVHHLSRVLQERPGGQRNININGFKKQNMENYSTQNQLSTRNFYRCTQVKD